MKARTVAQVIAAEAGGKTWAQRLSAMRDVASAIVNRANALGVSPEDVVGVTSEFNAYNKAMPAGTSRLTALAEQALADVMGGGVTHNGMFYAREYATQNLPKGLTEVKKAVDGHVYFSDPKGRAIRTAVGVRPVQKMDSLPKSIAFTPTAAPRATPQQANALGMSAMAGTRDFMSGNMARVANAAGTPPSTYAARPGVVPGGNLTARMADAPSVGSTIASALGIGSANAAERPQQRSLAAPNPSRFGPVASNVAALDPARMAPMQEGQNIAHLTAPSTMSPTDRALASWQRMAPTTDDMALAHLTNPAPNALGSTFPARPDMIAPNSFSNQPMLKAPVEQPIEQPVETVQTQPVARREPLRVSVTKTASVTPADPFGSRTVAGLKPTDRFTVDNIDAAIGGPRGATYSAGGGLTTFSRGPNIGYGVHNLQTGMTTLYSPSGNITGIRSNKPSGGFLSGLFGGGSSSSSSGGSSNSGRSLGGGFGERSIGGAGSTYSR